MNIQKLYTFIQEHKSFTIEYLVKQINIPRTITWLNNCKYKRLISWAASNGQVNILEWGIHQNPQILPDVEYIDCAAINGHINVLEWGEERDILPDKRGINQVAMDGHMNVRPQSDLFLFK